jgi:DNA-binding transcriptional ArsR family regulator
MADNDLDRTLCSVDESNPEAVSFAQARALAPDTVECLSRLFSSLSDPTRLKLLHALLITKELCVCDLAAIADLSVSAVSHQLRLLRDRNLVRARRDGRMVYYSLVDQHVTDLMDAGITHACHS